MKKIIKNARVLIDETLQNKEILFDENQILDIEDHIDDQEAQIIDAAGCTVLPGLVDTHVHLRSPGHEEKETIATGSKAAAHGGFTTIFAMPNVLPFPSDEKTMKEYLDKIEKEACVRVLPFGTITNQEAGKVPTDYQALKKLGIHWFSDDGVGVARDDVMENAMKKAKEADVLFSCHTEDMNYRKPLASVHESEITASKGWIGIPSACESEQLIRDLKLVEKIHNRYHADHISAKESVEALRNAKEKGLDVSGEVTVHHLLLEDKDVKGPNWKMNPPLRSHEDRLALIEGLESGALDFIANDHAPHTKEEKERGMEKSPFGIVSIETAFPLLYTEFVKNQKRWSLAQLVNWMSYKPAVRFGLEKTGKIEKGYRPDFTIVDLEEQYAIDPEKFESKGKNTPFAGWQVFGKVKETICMGQSVWKG